MLYGIDLGTTNTVIGYGNEIYSDLIKSSVNLETNTQEDDLSKKGVVHGYKIKMTIQDNEAGKIARNASSVVLKKAVDIANSKTGLDVKDLVISVPAAFTQLQRKGTIEAARMAGYKVKKLIDEPTAACIAAGLLNKDIYLVIDIGGGTSDISVVDNRSGKYIVKSTYGKFIGGDDLDNYIIDNYFQGHICTVMAALDPVTRGRLKEKAIEFKCGIEKGKVMTFSGVDFDGEEEIDLDYDDLDKAIRAVFHPVLDCIRSCIADANIDTDSLKALFVGGSCRNECLRNFIKSSIELPYIEILLDKYLAVAKGVSKYAEMVDKGEIEDFITSITKRIIAKPKGNKSEETLDFEIIKPNLPIPREESYVFETINEEPVAAFEIYTGESAYFKNCNFEGIVTFKIYPDGFKPKKGTPLFIEFSINSDNIFTVKCENLDIGFIDNGTLSFV